MNLSIKEQIEKQNIFIESLLKEAQNYRAKTNKSP